jgi:hypothetical protein
MNNRTHLWELQNSVYHSAVLEPLNLESVHFWTYVDINCFYKLYVRNLFLELCHVLLKHTVNVIDVFGTKSQKTSVIVTVMKAPPRQCSSTLHSNGEANQ